MKKPENIPDGIWNLFAQMVMDERERCAMIAERYPPLISDGPTIRVMNGGDVAKAIREQSPLDTARPHGAL